MKCKILAGNNKCISPHDKRRNQPTNRKRTKQAASAKKTICNGMSRSADSMRLIPLIARCVFKVTQLYHHRHPSDTELHTGDQ